MFLVYIAFAFDLGDNAARVVLALIGVAHLCLTLKHHRDIERGRRRRRPSARGEGARDKPRRSVAARIRRAMKRTE